MARAGKQRKIWLSMEKNTRATPSRGRPELETRLSRKWDLHTGKLQAGATGIMMGGDAKGETGQKERCHPRIEKPYEA